ncbi:lipopolysaccharide biosynthesis protein [Aeromicrobium endophyticum]|nr:oligosaccharide flippase family protein [Aeromicrobium endophyticum]
MIRRIGKLGWYGASVFATVLVGVVSIPVVISTAGAAAWSGVATGIAVGSAASVLVSWGWPISGPAEIAQTPSDHTKGQIWVDSVVARTPLFLTASVLSCGVVGFASPPHVYAAMASAVYAATTGLSSSWYFVGLGDPKRLFFLESLPRLSGTVIGVSLVYTTGTIILMPLTQVVSALGAVYLVFRFVRHQHLESSPERPSARTTRDRLRSQSPLVGTAGMAAIYSGMPMILVAKFDPAGLVAYGMADRLRGYAIIALTPVDQILQGWVPRGGRDDLRRRIRVALQTSFVLAIFCGIGFALLARPLADFLSGGKIAVPTDLVVPIAMILAVVTMSHCVGLACLMALGARSALLHSTGIGFFFGVPAVTFAALHTGAVAVAWTILAIEVCVCAYQTSALILRMRELA